MTHVFRLRFHVAGGYIHCRLFSRRAAWATHEKCGDFVLRRGDEFNSFFAQFPALEFLGDTPKDDPLRAYADEDDE